MLGNESALCRRRLGERMTGLRQRKSFSVSRWTINGIDIQFVHVKSRHPNAMPLIITHGWPGSILELTKSLARSPRGTPQHFLIANVSG